MAIGNKGYREAESQRTPGCGIDTEFTLEAADDQFRNAMTGENRQQIGVEVGVRSALANADIRRSDVKAGSKLPALRFELQGAVVGLVLDEYDGNAGIATAIRDKVDAIDDA